MLNHSNTADDTILTAALTAGATAIPVASAAGWPAPPFAAVLTPGTSATEEIVLVTAVVGATWTATRGYDGTTAKSHAAGATVRHAIIAADLTLTAADVGADPAGTASASLAAHVAAADPHPQYHTNARGDARYQPLDSDLTAIAALTTTAYGRALLALADAAALRTTAGAEAALGNPASDGFVLSSTAAGARSWVAPGGGVARGRIKVGSTMYWSLPGVVPIGATGTGALVANRLQYMPIIVDAPVTLTDLGFEVTTGAASSLVRCGLCTADTDWVPGALVSGTDAAEYDCSTTGEKSTTGLSIALPAGRYYLLMLANVNPPTVRLLRGVLPGLLFQAAWSGNVYTTNLFASQAYGPLPASPPAIGTLTAGNAPSFDYRVLIKYIPS